MAGKRSIAQRLRDAFLKPAQRKAKKRLQGLEERSSRPTKEESIVVRPSKKVKRVQQ